MNVAIQIRKIEAALEYEIVDLKPPNRNACANSLQALLLHLSQMIGMAGAILPSKAQASQPTRSTLFL